MLDFVYAAMARLRSDEEGQTVVEYALIVVLVSIVLVTALSLIDIGGVVSNINTALGL